MKEGSGRIESMVKIGEGLINRKKMVSFVSFFLRPLKNQAHVFVLHP